MQIWFFRPSSLIIFLNNNLRISILNSKSLFDILIILLINSSLPDFFIPLYIFLYTSSNTAGTKNNNVGEYSFILSLNFFILSTNAIVPPENSNTNAPRIPKVWWNGSSASVISLLVIGITASIAFKLLVIFLFDNSTIFDCDVVPDVNNKILLLSSSILISSIASITFLKVVFSLVFNITSCTVNISS